MRFAIGLVCCLAAIFCLGIPAAAQFENAVWDTITADTLQDAIYAGGLATNGYEQCHLAYVKHRAGGWWLYYRFVDLLAGMSPEIAVDTTRSVNRPAIASRFSDNDYNIDILYEASSGIWHCASGGPFGPWVCSDLASSPEPEHNPCVAWGNNYLHGAWITYINNSEFKIAYMRAGAGQPEIDIIEESELGELGVGAQPAVAATGDLPHIFYRGISGANYRIHHAYKVHPDSEWVIEYLFTPNADDYSVSVSQGWGRLEVAISGGDGWGMPGRIYYMQYDPDTHQWTAPELATGQYSAVNGSIVRAYSTIYVASCGVSDNTYNGDIYLSTKTGTDAFQTTLLGNYPLSQEPLLTSIVGEYGVLVFGAPVGAEEQRNIELIYYGPDIVNSVAEPGAPSTVGLCRSYPNPFNSAATIAFGLERPADVTIDIFDILGQRIETLAESGLSAGEHAVAWDAADVPSGVYFYRLTANGYSRTGKMALVK